MEEKEWTITLSDGTKFENLRLNGNNYVSEEELTVDMFDGKLSTVTISDGQNEEIHHNMRLIQICQYSDGWYFILEDISEAEIESIRIRADIDYLAAVMDIDLEEG